MNAHGTSTPMNDRGECAAIRAVFGSHAGDVAVSSTKSLMGHLIAAAGAVEAAIAALAIRDGVLPVNANLRQRDPDCDLDFRRRRGAPPFRARRVVELLRLRRLEQLSGAAASGRSGSVSRTRAVITGAGAICSAGKRVEEIWDAAHAGRDAIGRVGQWQSTYWSQPRAGEIADFAPAALLADRKIQKYLSRGDVLGLYAAGAAIDDAGLLAFRDSLDADAAERFNDATGVFVGSGGATFSGSYDFFRTLAVAGSEPGGFGGAVESTVDPLWLLRNLPNNVLGHLGIRCGFKGPNACITHHAVSGALAVAEAAATVAAGDAERAVAVGHHAPIEPQMVLGFEALGLLAKDGLTPFDARRSGTLPGEGAAAIVLESPTAAAARGARRCGEILGSGCATEAEGLLDVRGDGDGLSRAIELALDDAGIVAERRRHDRRARQRNAAVRCLRSRRAAPRLRRRGRRRSRPSSGSSAICWRRLERWTSCWRWSRCAAASCRASPRSMRSIPPSATCLCRAPRRRRVPTQRWC